MTQCKPHFITYSDRGPYLVCECGWSTAIQDIQVSPLTSDLYGTFFKAGFHIGQVYEIHLRNIKEEVNV